ncbi:hypothetical protein LTR94_005421 [Friedmanniomyces endolithicus]|nr:hypothetical protein LTR94_005421 [Friedmanniomyces endolithicus]
MARPSAKAAIRPSSTSRRLVPFAPYDIFIGATVAAAGARTVLVEDRRQARGLGRRGDGAAGQGIALDAGAALGPQPGTGQPKALGGLPAVGAPGDQGGVGPVARRQRQLQGSPPIAPGPAGQAVAGRSVPGGRRAGPRAAEDLTHRKAPTDQVRAADLAPRRIGRSGHVHGLQQARPVQGRRRRDRDDRGLGLVLGLRRSGFRRRLLALTARQDETEEEDRRRERDDRRARRRDRFEHEPSLA